MTADYKFITTMNMLADTIMSLNSVPVPHPRIYDSSLSLHHGIENFFVFSRDTVRQLMGMTQVLSYKFYQIFILVIVKIL